MYPDHNIRRIPSSRNTIDERLDPTRFATQSQNLKLLYVDEIFCNMLFLVAGALESDTPELRSVLRPSTIRRHDRRTRRMFLSTQRLSASAAGKMLSTYTKFRVTHTAMENPKILSAGIIDARFDANEHALVVVVTNIALPVFWNVFVRATAYSSGEDVSSCPSSPLRWS
jgi:hypothetical protein